MQVELITRQDLAAFKNELLTEMKALLQPGQGQSKQWLKSAEVRKLLNISPGTLQNLRINGTLRYTKIGGMMYYKLEDIHKVLEGGHK
jgi:hypothetical protein